MATRASIGVRLHSVATTAARFVVGYNRAHFPRLAAMSLRSITRKGQVVAGLYPSYSWKDIWPWLVRAWDASAVAAWRDVRCEQMWEKLVDFYDGLSLFRYRTTGGEVVAPLLVRPEWLRLHPQSLRLLVRDEEMPFSPDARQRRFLAQYHRIREALDQPESWDDPVFRLVDIASSDAKVELTFRRGMFFDAMMGQYILD